MRSFFVQIFLSFWITLLLMFVIGALIFPNPAHPPPETLHLALQSTLARLARLQPDGGSIVCADQWGTELFVIASEGTDLCGRPVRDAVLQLASRAKNTNRQQFSVIDSHWAVAQPPDAPAAPRYITVLLVPQPGQTWFPRFPAWTLPASALVTFVFAYLLTKPVRALRSAFRRFAAGDMSVRLPVARNVLRDWGGADIRTLMIDFNEMADRIQALLEAHKTLLRDVSHELRSPLARLNVALELAREETGSSSALDRAELESSRLNTLIGELLSLSLMETIHDVPGSKLVHTGDIIENLMPDLQFEAEARGCRVIHKRLGDCPIPGSEELLRRALENIIRNAIRYSPSGAEVTIETSTDSGSSALIRVCDSGPGVPDDNLQAIFRPFYRVDSARQTTTGGFGVGLAIAQRAVQIHGGTIRAFNRQTGGLCVELRVPCES